MDNNVIIRVAADVNEPSFAKAKGAISALGRGPGSSGWDDFLDNMDAGGKKLDKASKKNDTLTKSFKKLGTFLKGSLKFAFKAMLWETAALSVALAAIPVLFKAAQLAVKGWGLALQGAAAAAAGAAAAMMTYFAAQRQYAGAMGALNYQKGPFANKQTAAVAGLRNIQSDADLAVVGIQGLNAAFASLGKNAAYTGDMKASFKSLGDFAVASGDLEKGMTSAGEFLGVLRKEGSLNAKARAAGEGLGTEFQEAMKEATKKGAISEQDFIAALNSGSLNEKVVGLLDGVNNTLIGQVKGFATEMKTLFMDMGQYFLPDVQVAFDKLSKIVRTTVLQLSSAMQGFAKGSFLDSIISGIEKVSNFLVNLFSNHLPKVEGAFTRIKDWWMGIQVFFRKFIVYLKELRPAGQALIDNFIKPLVKAFTSGIGKNLKNFGKDITLNKDKIKDFAGGLAKLLKAFGRLMGQLRKAFITALPIITSIIKKIATFFDFVSRLLEMIAGKSGKKGGSSWGVAIGALLIGGFYIGFKLLLKSKIWKTFLGPIVKSFGKEMLKKAAAYLNPFSAARMTPQGMMSTGGAVGLGALAAFGPKDQRGVYAAGAAATYLAPPMIGPVPTAPFIVGGTLLTAAAKSKTAGGGALQGAGGGAAIGAGIGMLTPAGPLGAAIGAAIGALLGAIAGAIAGALGQTRERNKAIDQASEAFADKLYSGILHGIQKGQSAQQMQNQLDKASNKVNALFGYAMELNQMQENSSAAQGGTQRLEYAQKYLAKDDPLRIGLESQRDAWSSGDSEKEASLTSKNNKLWEKRQKSLWAKSDGILKWLEDTKVFTADEIKNLRDNVYNKKDISGPGNRKFAEDANALLAQARNVVTYLGEVSNNNLMNLASATGMATDELAKLAQESGVNLYDETLNVIDAMKKMGIQIPRTVEEINRLLTNKFIKIGQDVVDEIFKPVVAGNAMDQAAEEARGVKGALSNDIVMNIVQTAFENANQMFPNDPMKARQWVMANLGQGGAQFTAKGGPLEGRASDFAAGTLGGNAVAAYGMKTAAEVGKQATMGINDFLNESLTGPNKQGVGMNDMQGILNSAMGAGLISPEQLAMITTKAGQMADASAKEGGTKYATGQEALAALLAGTGIDVNAFNGALTTYGRAVRPDDPAEKARLTAMQDAIASGFAQTPAWYTDAPTWWRTGMTISAQKKKEGDGFDITLTGAGTVGNAGDASQSGVDQPGPKRDTATSRLARTMARHNRFNSMIAGKRSVISSMRTDGLGSIDSDHVTGNAYDLTGQNLGAYATMVNNAGGFAEFHNAGGRHLHVVPGQGTPIGDTSSPVVVATPSGSSGSSTFNITVNGANANPEQIAMVVMQKIQSAERSRRERR